MEHGDRLSQVIEVRQEPYPLDVVCTQEELDLRLLNQVSILWWTSWPHSTNN